MFHFEKSVCVTLDVLRCVRAIPFKVLRGAKRTISMTPLPHYFFSLTTPVTFHLPAPKECFWGLIPPQHFIFSQTALLQHFIFGLHPVPALRI